MSREKKTALVTGGGRGIGLGISKALAEDGFDIAFCGVRSADEVTTTIEELQRKKVDVLYTQADLGSAEARSRLLSQVRNRFGQLNLLVNNAGVAPKERQDVLAATEASFDRVLNINLKGPYFLTQGVAKWMVQQREADPSYTGSIVNVSSISASVASVSRGEYCLSKAALSMATKLWATRLAEFGIPVFEIQPGLVQTDMTANVKKKYDHFIETGGTLEKRWGTPEDVGRIVKMLARGDLPYSTGQVIVMDGGLTLPRL
jgi:3-oxoacyl-[acyl-carrier protein] reductase